MKATEKSIKLCILIAMAAAVLFVSVDLSFPILETYIFIENLRIVLSY